MQHPLYTIHKNSWTTVRYILCNILNYMYAYTGRLDSVSPSSYYSRRFNPLKYYRATTAKKYANCILLFMRTQFPSRLRFDPFIIVLIICLTLYVGAPIFTIDSVRIDHGLSFKCDSNSDYQNRRLLAALKIH